MIGDNPRVPPSPQDRYYLNGKFTAQRTTGVQRVAAQHLRALDAMGQALPGRWTLLCPPGVALPRLRHIEARTLGRRRWPLHLWEQTLLPWASRDGLLVNLAGAAPWAARRQAVLIHDAAVFDHPEAYTRSFVVWYRRLFAHLARHAERLLTVSAFSRQRLALHLGLPRQRLAVVHNGADHLEGVEPEPGLVEGLGLTGCRFLLAVASDNPTKNLAALVAAYASLPPAPDLRLVLVGGRNQRVFAAGGMTADPPGVMRTGPLGDAALVALYRSAVALVFPSTYEGFGLPPLEAMGCGCPVLAAHAAALPEVCGAAALYADPSSISGLAQAMQRLLDDGALRERLRAAGHAQARRYRWAEASAALLRALRAERSP